MNNEDTSNIWISTVAANFNLKKKTTESINFHSELGTYYLSDQNAYYLLGNFETTKIDEETIFEQGYLHIRTVLNRKKKIAFEPFVQLQYDLGKGLKRRHLYGSNIRANLYSDSSIVLSVGTGAFYENETWIDDQNLILLNNNLKSNNYISTQTTINEWLQFVLTGYYQSTFNEFLFSRIILDSNLQMKFTDKFAYDVNFELSVDRKPVVETGRLVYLLSSGFRYRF